MKTTFVFRRDWIEKISSPKWSRWTIKWSSKSGFFRGPYVCPCCLGCFENNRNIPLLLSITFLKDPTEPEVPRSLSLLYGLRFRQFPWIRRDSKAFTSVKKLQRIIRMNNRCVFGLAYELVHTFCRFLRSFNFCWAPLDPMRKKSCTTAA